VKQSQLHNTVYARKVKANGAWDIAVSYRSAKWAAQDNYYYLHVVQVDGEVVWVSPMWIGEQRSAQKK
jgi:hypothetical protein